MAKMQQMDEHSGEWDFEPRDADSDVHIDDWYMTTPPAPEVVKLAKEPEAESAEQQKIRILQNISLNLDALNNLEADGKYLGKIRKILETRKVELKAKPEKQATVSDISDWLEW